MQLAVGLLQRDHTEAVAVHNISGAVVVLVRVGGRVGDMAVKY